jgi:CubicO group peptidase (beta-lactamase class C family)
MQLEEQGLLELDDPVGDYLPFFNVTYESVPTEVTIRQLLNHSSGVPDSMPEIFSWIHYEGNPPVNQTALIREKMPDYDELKFAPGSEDSYSNVGYMVLGAIIEAVSGQTYEEYVLDNIITPLGMQNTNFVYTEAMAEHEAIGSQHVVNMFTPFFYTLGIKDVIRERIGMRYWLNRVYNDQTPPTGLIGPVTDFALFMIAYLDDGGEILQPESVALMNSVMDELISPKEELRWLGWIARLTEDGRRFLWHGGGGPGMQSLFRVYPDEKLGVVVIGNHTTIDREGLADMLAGMAW